MDRLANHRKIAFDLDGTLIDGIASTRIAHYIKRHPEKTYYVITLRTPDQIATISSELDTNGLNIEMFEKVVPLPPRLAFEFNEDQQMRREEAMPSLDQVSDDDTLLPGEYKIMNWKGFITRKLGASVLVDDMPYLSAPGCERFGVTLIDVASIASDIAETRFYARLMQCWNESPICVGTLDQFSM